MKGFDTFDATARAEVQVLYIKGFQNEEMARQFADKLNTLVPVTAKPVKTQGRCEIQVTASAAFQ